MRRCPTGVRWANHNAWSFGEKHQLKLSRITGNAIRNWYNRKRVEKNHTAEKLKMFIAMNRFKVIKEERKAFEDLWVTRQSRLDEVKGFRAFHLLRGPERDDHVLYSSHTIWASQEDFTAWTKSDQFRAAHQHAGERKPLTRGHPELEGFEVIQTIEITHPSA
jgi:heme-degrading monooxygenase HmoA